MTIADIKILDAKSLGIKPGKWVLLVKNPLTRETWYRPFQYKQDALRVANEFNLKGQSFESILEYYGTHYFQKYEG